MEKKAKQRYISGGVIGLLTLFFLIGGIITKVDLNAFSIGIFIVALLFTLNLLIFNKKWISIFAFAMVAVFIIIFFSLPYIFKSGMTMKKEYVSISTPNSYTKEYLVYENIDFNAYLEYPKLGIRDSRFREQLATNKLYYQRPYIKPIYISNNIDYNSRCDSVHVVGDLYQIIIDCKKNKPANQDYNKAVTDLCVRKINPSNYIITDNMVVREINAIESSCKDYEIQ